MKTLGMRSWRQMTEAGMFVKGSDCEGNFVHDGGKFMVYPNPNRVAESVWVQEILVRGAVYLRHNAGRDARCHDFASTDALALLKVHGEFSAVCR